VICNNSRWTMVLAVVVALLVAASPASADALGISWGGDVYSVDTATGSGTLIGASGFVGTNSMAEHNGVFYSATGNHLTGSEIFTIDPVTGVGTLVTTTSSAMDIRGMAFAADGTMYVVRQGGASTAVSDPDELWTVNATTGATAFVGNLGRADFQALGFAPSGALYAWSINEGLFSVNVATGAATDVNLAVGTDGADVQTLDFAADGTLFGATSALYTIDSGTGAVAFVGSGGYSDLRGLSINSNPVPEPSTFVLVALASLGVIAARRRRARR